MKTYWVITLVCGFLLMGCGEKETVTSTEPTSVPTEKSTVGEQAKQAADDVAKQAAEMVKKGTRLIENTAAETKQAVKKAVKTVAEDATAVASLAKEQTAATVDSSKQKVVEAKEQLEQEGSQLIDSLHENSTDKKTQNNSPLPSAATVDDRITAFSKIAGKGQVPESLLIENKKGDVTLPHAEHGKLYGCAACHEDTPPGPFELEKDTAHAMCKGCHKEQGGPTKCSGCHNN